MEKDNVKNCILIISTKTKTIIRRESIEAVSIYAQSLLAIILLN